MFCCFGINAILTVLMNTEINASLHSIIKLDPIMYLNFSHKHAFRHVPLL